LQVIGAGFGRTGTLSLKVALEKLGYEPCYHMTEVMDKPSHVEFWAEAPEKLDRGEEVEWERVFAGYEATVDFPGCVFYKELMQEYPGAKVLLTVRDTGRWYDSASQTILSSPESSGSRGARLLFGLATRFVPVFRRAPRMIDNVMRDRAFGGDMTTPEHVKEVYEAHIEEVKRTVPEEKLLVYEVKEGWEPLCEFLSVPVPDEPFPHVNERDDFGKVMAQRMVRAVAPAALGAAAVAAALILAVRLAAKGGRR